MQRHVDYYARNDEILRLGKELGEELTDENKEHVVSLECAWANAFTPLPATLSIVAIVRR